ncbi:DUF3172 domain-containing protein [Pantanalinema rosaneae CENA516]|uniref:DUF3172 domain-containing protein n=1 Tax=Pantanalinema rosaneae TaxID=1620701 RepID=UPI003D6E7287
MTMKRKPRSSTPNYRYDREPERNREREFFDEPPMPDSTSKRGGNKPNRSLAFNATTLAVLAGVLILGIGIGLGFNSVASTVGSGEKIVNQIDLDLKAPNSDICVQYGASAIVMNTRIFVTLNPLNVFVSQPTTQPGCVLRTNNWAILEQRGLLKNEQARDCKQRMNTFGFTGQLETSPEIDCVYQNDAAKNLFLSQPGLSAPENQRF